MSYARQIGLNAADKVLFIADGAPWIWQRIQRLIAALGLSPTQVLGLIDFYHAAKQLSDAVKLRRWSATQRTRWLNRTRGLLKRARVDEVITALRELCRGRTAGKIRTHLNYFLKNRHRFAYTTMVGLGLPRGSGAVESAIRRVINLRIKGASIYWLPESVDAILLRLLRQRLQHLRPEPGRAQRRVVHRDGSAAMSDNAAVTRALNAARARTCFDPSVRSPDRLGSRAPLQAHFWIGKDSGPGASRSVVGRTRRLPSDPQ